MNTSNQGVKLEKLMSSPFTIIFGFLASLIGQKFIEKASLLLNQDYQNWTIYEKIGIIILIRMFR
jgi:hypothetical protein